MRQLRGPDPGDRYDDTHLRRKLTEVAEQTKPHPFIVRVTSRRSPTEAEPERRPRDTFRRTMTPQLTATGKLRIGARGKPAELFRR